VPNILISVPTKKVKQPISVTHPELAKEADGWDPSLVPAGSHKKLMWKCSKGHLWLSTVLNRSRGSGCGVCANKVLLPGYNDLATTNPALAEQAYGWDPTTVISGTRKVSWKCTEGHIWTARIYSRIAGAGCAVCSNLEVLPGINDIATTHPRLASEANGWDPKEFVAGSQELVSWVCNLGHSWSASITSRVRGNGCPVCANKVIVNGFNDLATTHPELAEYADGWDPSTVAAGSNKVFSWKCPKGHKWKCKAITMYNGQRCAVCIGRKLLIGFNDLQTTHPELSMEAEGWDPTSVSFGTMSKKKWKCKEGHTWSSAVYDRSRGAGCPSCAKYGFDPNIDGFLYFLEHNVWEMYQVGITNIPEKRLKVHGNLGWGLLELRGPMDGHLTQQWETAILRMLKARGADLSNDKIAGKFDGYSEAWSKSTFEVNSIKELMRLTEEFENK
jgi:hypothetical protein